jgi:mycofactocin precursor
MWRTRCSKGRSAGVGFVPGTEILSEYQENLMTKEPEEKEQTLKNRESQDEFDQDILEEIEIEDLTVDGICGVY